MEISEKNGSEIRSCKVILNNSAHWWPVSRISFFEVGSPNTIPNKFKLSKELPENSIVFPRKKVAATCKKEHKLF